MWPCLFAAYWPCNIACQSLPLSRASKNSINDLQIWHWLLWGRIKNLFCHLVLCFDGEGAWSTFDHYKLLRFNISSPVSRSKTRPSCSMVRPRCRPLGVAAYSRRPGPAPGPALLLLGAPPMFASNRKSICFCLDGVYSKKTFLILIISAMPNKPVFQSLPVDSQGSIMRCGPVLGFFSYSSCSQKYRAAAAYPRTATGETG